MEGTTFGRSGMKSTARSSYCPIPDQARVTEVVEKEPESIKEHVFLGSLGHRVLMDIKEARPKPLGLGDNPKMAVFYRTSNSNFGVMASQINPATGRNIITGEETGLLYRRPVGHDLNGRFTTTLAQAGMQTNGTVAHCSHASLRENAMESDIRLHHPQMG